MEQPRPLKGTKVQTLESFNHTKTPYPGFVRSLMMLRATILCFLHCVYPVVLQKIEICECMRTLVMHIHVRTTRPQFDEIQLNILSLLFEDKMPCGRQPSLKERHSTQTGIVHCFDRTAILDMRIEKQSPNEAILYSKFQNFPIEQNIFWDTISF